MTLPLPPMSCDRSLLLPSLLLRREDAPTCASIADWLPLWRSTRGAHADEDPFVAAVAAALRADRLAWAFFSGYQGALHAAFPASLGGASPRVAALCANEAGRRLTDIDTALHASEGASRLRGAKAWMLAGIDDLDLFVLARTAGGPASGPGSLAIVRVRADAPGVIAASPRPQGMMPELPHAAVEFRDVRVDADQLVAGDGYADHVKPFRLREDVFVTGCALAFLLSHGQRAAWPGTWRQCCVATVVTLERCASLSPASAATAVVTAGALAAAGDLIREVEGLWSTDDEVAAGRWRRDKSLLELGHDARRQRIVKAWAQVDAPAPTA